MPHVADYPLAGGIEGAMRVGARVGVVAAADLATNVATAKANVDARTNGPTVHVTDKVHALPVKAAIEKMDGVLASGLSSGGSLTNVYNAADNTFNESALGPVL